MAFTALLAIWWAALPTGRAQQAAPESAHAQAQQPSPPAPLTDAPTYDGDWWLTLGGWEQNGFVSGYRDCYDSEYRGTGSFTKEVQSYVDDLNKYFLADPLRRKQTVSDALDAVRGVASDSPLPIYKAENPPPEDQVQPVYDGRFWFDADAAAELGFVEGYLACHAVKLKDSDGKFSKPPSEYVTLINKKFEITDDSDEISADKAPVRVATVLHRLKDDEGAPPKPAS